MVLLHLEKWDRPTPPAPAPSNALGFLNYLRFTAMNCRTKPQADLFEACALLQITPDATCQAYAEALMRCLPEALGKPAKLHAPGVSELSFDERWLLQLGLACMAKNEASVSFLLRSRLAHQHRRMVLFLIHQISGHFHSV